MDREQLITKFDFRYPILCGKITCPINVPNRPPKNEINSEKFILFNMELSVTKSEIDVQKIYKSKRNISCFEIGNELTENLIKNLI